MAKNSSEKVMTVQKNQEPHIAMSTQRTCLRPCKKISKRAKKSIQSPNSQVSLPKGSSQGKAGKIATKDSELHKHVFQDEGVPDKEKLAYCSGGTRFLLGEKKGSRILCYCCNKEVSASVFEAHAGFASRRKPYTYIYVVSTGQLLRNVENGKRAGEEVVERHGSHCYACKESGDLRNCSGCLKFFHMGCASLVQYCEKWFCTSCKSQSQGDHNTDSVIIQTSAESYKVNVRQTKCWLCRGVEFTDSQFGPNTILLCDQCEREYHVSCLKAHELADLKELPEGNWFCCSGCREVHLSLQNLLEKGEQKLLKSDVSSRNHMEENTEIATHCAVGFRLLKGPLTCNREERLQLLSQTIKVLEKGFGIISCGGTRRGLIRPIVNGTKFGNKQFRGMYCAVLLVNSKVVSVAIFRLFGREFAELPLVTTLSAHRGKGYFYAIFDKICRFCVSNRVKKIVLPATKDAMDMWLKLGFEKMTPDQISEQLEFFPDVVQFSDVVVLEKTLPQHQLSDAANDVQAGTSVVV